MKGDLRTFWCILSATALIACSGSQTKADSPPTNDGAEATADAEANQPPQQGAMWGYGDEAGPEQWGQLSPEFEMCDMGKNQSPVDITDAVQAQNLPSPNLSYDESPSEFVHKGFSLQLNYASGNEMEVGGETFELLQMHFHVPGEHTIEGREFPLEAHFVHSDDDGNLAVLAVMFEEGEESEQLEELLDEPPTEKGQKISMQDTEFEASEMLPDSLAHYRYNGSLTTPPCSEGVRFFILEEPQTASSEQIATIRDAVGHDNARPTQPINARVIVH